MQHISDREPQPQAFLSTLAGSSHLISVLAVLALMSGWGIFLYLGIGSLVSLEPPPDPTPVNPDSDDEIHEKSPGDTSPAEDDSEQQVARYEDVEAALVLRLQRTDLIPRIEKLESQITQTEDSARRFDEKMAALRTSDPGRRLATSGNARKFLFLSRYLGDFNPDAMRQVVFGFKETIDSARQPLGDMTYFDAAIAGMQSNLESNQRKLKTASAAIDQLLRDTPVAQPVTLQEAIDRLATTDTDAVKGAVNGKLQDLSDTQIAQLQKENDRRA